MPKSRPIKAPKLSAQERDWQEVQNAPTDYAESVLSHAYHKRWSARPAVKASAKPVKARRVWFPDHTPARRGYISVSYHKPPAYQEPQKMVCLPVDAAAYDQMVEQQAAAIYEAHDMRPWAEVSDIRGDRFCLIARAALAAIGIIRPS